jgi:hypothetical protein
MPIKLAQPAGPYPGKINDAASTIWGFFHKAYHLEKKLG